MVVGLLGILKAGGAYVPLDPAYPQNLAFIFCQFQVAANAVRVLTVLPEHESAKVSVP